MMTRRENSSRVTESLYKSREQSYVSFPTRRMQVVFRFSMMSSNKNKAEETGAQTKRPTRTLKVVNQQKRMSPHQATIKMTSNHSISSSSKNNDEMLKIIMHSHSRNNKQEKIANLAGCKTHKRSASTQLSLALLAWSLVLQQLLQLALGSGSGQLAEAVSVQRLQVPDLVVVSVDQQQQRPSGGQSPMMGASDRGSTRFGLYQQQQQQQHMQATGQQMPRLQLQNGPEAASLITSNNQQQQLETMTTAQQQQQQQQQQVTFECLISYDRKKDRNLIVKWHHDERNEPIYQWILELNKRSIAPQYRAFIAPIISGGGGAGGTDGAHRQVQQEHSAGSQQHLSSSTISATATTAAAAAAAGQQSAATGTSASPLNFNLTNAATAANASSLSNQVQLLEAGFRLIRPTKELGGRYTCSAISSQNDDSKSKKMIVYTPPKSFRFNASRTDIGALLANQRDRLIQLTQPTLPSYSSSGGQISQLPLAYRMRGLDAASGGIPQTAAVPPMLTTISPQMYSTIDYVNVNQQRARQQQQLGAATTAAGSSWHPVSNSMNPYDRQLQQQQHVIMANNGGGRSASTTMAGAGASALRPRHGIKLVCDIDQVFPVPDMSIYRVLAKVDGSHPERLAKLETKIERDPYTGLFHVQVTSILDDDELQNIRQNYLSAQLLSAAASSPSRAVSASELEIQFECVIALTNLELSKYADNKRSIIYRPGQQQQLADNFLDDTNPDKLEQVTANSGAARLKVPPLMQVALLYLLLFSGAYRWWLWRQLH